MTRGRLQNTVHEGVWIFYVLFLERRLFSMKNNLQQSLEQQQY